jgi:hypothetical protein
VVVLCAHPCLHSLQVCETEAAVKPTPRTAKPQAPTTNSLLDFNLPVKFLGDRGPVDVPFVQALVHTPEDDFSPILRSFFPA